METEWNLRGNKNMRLLQENLQHIKGTLVVLVKVIRELDIAPRGVDIQHNLESVKNMFNNL